jgi:hypothetical protein
VASILSRTTVTNAHPIDIETLADLKRHLADIDAPEEDIQDAADAFLHCTIKLEGVDTRAAHLLENYLESLGGGMAMSCSPGSSRESRSGLT